MRRFLFVAVLAVGVVVAAKAQTAADNPKVFDDGKWRTEPWLDCFVPDDFICVKPHVSLVGRAAAEVVWLTKEPGSGWVDWTQDGWATTNRAWSSKYGVRDFNERIHKSRVAGFDPCRKVEYRAVSMKLIQVATGHIRFEGEPDYDWRDRKSWSALAVKRRDYTSGAVTHVEEGSFGPLERPGGRFSIIAFNDVHHSLPIYTNLLKYAGGEVDFAIFNGDIIDHCRSEDDIVKHVNAPMAHVGRALNCPVRYVRGNHELVQAFPRHLADYMGLQDGRFYGAVTVGGIRMLFLDTGSCCPDDATQKGRDEWDFDGYIAEENAWLKSELASAEWKDAKVRLVFAHIPPVWRDRKGDLHAEAGRVGEFLALLNGQGVAAFIGAHQHTPQRLEPNEFADYPVFIGGAPYMDKATLIRCDVADGAIAVKAYDANGGVAYETTAR